MAPASRDSNMEAAMRRKVKTSETLISEFMNFCFCFKLIISECIDAIKLTLQQRYSKISFFLLITCPLLAHVSLPNRVHSHMCASPSYCCGNDPSSPLLVHILWACIRQERNARVRPELDWARNGKRELRQVSTRTLILPSVEEWAPPILFQLHSKGVSGNSIFFQLPHS